MADSMFILAYFVWKKPH